MDLADLRDLIARHTRHGDVRIGRSATISAIDRVGPPEFSATGTLLVLLAQGAKRLVVGERVHTYRPGEFLVASLDLPTVGNFVEASRAEPALGFSLQLRPELVGELLLQPAAAEVAPSSRVAAPGIGVAPVSADIVDAVARMVRLLDRPRDRDVLAPLYERELVWLTLQSPLGASVRQLGTADSALRRVGDAVTLLRERYAGPVRVDELAEVTRMSPSAFYRNFQAATSMSPIQFQKHLRLQEARMRLLAARADIAGIAYDVGYESPSQFSRDYRRSFGLSPSQELRRAQASARA
jgi:AraC-like DNA-binding protein